MITASTARLFSQDAQRMLKEFPPRTEGGRVLRRCFADIRDNAAWGRTECRMNPLPVDAEATRQVNIAMHFLRREEFGFKVTRVEIPDEGDPENPGWITLDISWGE